ncbi:MAG TPA: DUF5666 domain-containing protein [Anaerolineales bacterium]|nr:DUF5666 domain-containing protein [Anaerolineales bacterium]
MNNVYDALEICLQEIEKGADLETVLRLYPDLADELRPILETSVEARNMAAGGPTPDVLRRGRSRVLQQAAQMREAKAQTSRRLWSVPLRRTLVSLAVIVALFVSSTNLVRAATTTLPGDNLYPVKRTWEDVLVMFTFNMQARQLLEVEHENERLEELYELFAEGRLAKVDFAGTVTRQNGDLWLVSKVPVVISAGTDLRDPPILPGDAVRVRGVTQADGTVLAERVERLSEGTPLPVVDEDDSLENASELSGNENESEEQDSDDDSSGPGSAGTPRPAPASEKVSLDGVVDSIHGTLVVVNGQPMNISGAEIKGTPSTGTTVRVEGYYDASGLFIVTKIEFRDGGSDGGSESDDNDDSNGNDNVDGNQANDNDNSAGDDNDNSNDSDNNDDNANDNSGDDD